LSSEREDEDAGEVEHEGEFKYNKPEEEIAYVPLSTPALLQELTPLSSVMVRLVGCGTTSAVLRLPVTSSLSPAVSTRARPRQSSSRCVDWCARRRKKAVRFLSSVLSFLFPRLTLLRSRQTSKSSPTPAASPASLKVPTTFPSTLASSAVAFSTRLTWERATRVRRRGVGRRVWPRLSERESHCSFPSSPRKRPDQRGCVSES
jgi:hypothetical protein